MANGVIGRIYYIDSGASTLSDFEMRVNSITFAATNTTSTIQLSFLSNTAQIVYQMTSPDNNPVTVSTFLGEVYFERLYVNTLTAGTAWIYFS